MYAIRSYYVGDAGVLGLGVAVEVDDTVVVGHHVLEQGVALDCAEDLRLILGREIDALGVAPSLEVEDAVVVPAVLVVTDELAGGVGRKGGLAGSGEAEEQADVSALADVGAAVHSYNFV